MNSAKWIGAAQNYSRAAQAAAQCDRNTPGEFSNKVDMDKVRRREEILRVADDLEHFMLGQDGEAAMRLLAASGRHINFAERNEGGGSGVVFFINSNGPQLSVEAMGMWTAYSRNVPKPRIVPIKVDEIIEAAVVIGGKEPSSIMTWFHQELDKIADEAPVPSTVS